MRKIIFICSLLLLLISFEGFAESAKRIALNTELTPSGTWVNIGDPIGVSGYDDLGLFVDLSPNGAVNTQFRISARIADDSTDYILAEPLTDGGTIVVRSNIELGEDATQTTFINFEIDGSMEYAQVQATTTNDTVTVLGGHLNDVYMTRSRKR